MREKREAIMNRIVDDANQMFDQIMTTDQFGYKTKPRAFGFYINRMG